MTVEFRPTSRFNELKGLAEERNASKEWSGVLEIKPSVNRVVKLRGYLPTARDIEDIFYDLTEYDQIEISYNDLVGRLSKLAELEASYYPLAENLGARAAISSRQHERIPDFIDLAKDTTARIVWLLWKPEKDEDFIDLHRRVVDHLKRGLFFDWNKAYKSKPYSHVEGYLFERGTPYYEVKTKSPRIRPIYRLRHAIQHLSLPSTVASIDLATPIEKIASFALMGYYPNGRGLIKVAKEVGVKRETLSSALDRAVDRLVVAKDDVTPQRGIKTIIEELIQNGLMRYPSGKVVERTNPRLSLLKKVERLPVDLSKRDEEIISLAIMHENGRFTYSTEEIAGQLGLGKALVYRVIKKVSKQIALLYL